MCSHVCVCVCINNLFDCGFRADMKGVGDSLGQIEGLPSSCLTSLHRHWPPQIHLDLDETRVHTARTLTETELMFQCGHCGSCYMISLSEPSSPNKLSVTCRTDGPRWRKTILISLLHMGLGGVCGKVTSRQKRPSMKRSKKTSRRQRWNDKKTNGMNKKDKS